MAEFQFCKPRLLKWKQIAQPSTKVGWAMEGKEDKNYVYTNARVKKL
jgi:hypothetical protein